MLWWHNKVCGACTSSSRTARCGPRQGPSPASCIPRSWLLHPQVPLFGRPLLHVHIVARRSPTTQCTAMPGVLRRRACHNRARDNTPRLPHAPPCPPIGRPQRCTRQVGRRAASCTCPGCPSLALAAFPAHPEPRIPFIPFLLPKAPTKHVCNLRDQRVPQQSSVPSPPSPSELQSQSAPASPRPPHLSSLVMGSVGLLANVCPLRLFQCNTVLRPRIAQTHPAPPAWARCVRRGSSRIPPPCRGPATGSRSR